MKDSPKCCLIEYLFASSPGIKYTDENLKRSRALTLVASGHHGLATRLVGEGAGDNDELTVNRCHVESGQGMNAVGEGEGGLW